MDIKLSNSTKKEISILAFSEGLKSSTIQVISSKAQVMIVGALSVPCCYFGELTQEQIKQYCSKGECSYREDGDEYILTVARAGRELRPIDKQAIGLDRVIKAVGEVNECLLQIAEQQLNRLQK